MKAIVLEQLNQQLGLIETDIPQIEPHEVLVRLKAAALNHRDLWIQKGQYAGIRLPIILGADGSGIVEQIGTHVGSNWLNKAVIINPSMNWGSDPRVQAKDYVILGTPHNGTFAQYVKIDARLLNEKPEHLSFEEAAALPLAGLTAYRALVKRAGAKNGENVLITGAGGGVALLATQFAIALGCQTYVTSSSSNKIAQTLKLGVKYGAVYNEPDWDKNLKQQSGGFDVIIDSSGGDTFAKLVDLAKPAGRIAMYGATQGVFNSGIPAKIFWKQLDILGSTMGNDEEFAEMIAFVNQHQIVPIVHQSFPLNQAQQAIDVMAKGEQLGKIVLTIP
ncbi:MAG: zinc-binding dehydrogenase [Bacteroidia bacterium]|jgi:NADPH:quinone reductase-like Zn-dependent oxidoreductase|nr:zinc-binding dehydrogenase [Bacteroidia bacterium]